MAKKKTHKRAGSAASKEAKPISTSQAGGTTEQNTAGGEQFPIVGIGASAGGLGALQTLITSMPESPGLAWVVILHLDPTKKSLAPEILAKHTTLPVREVEDEPRVRPNRIYLAPPGKYLSIAGGELHLSEPDQPRGKRMAIDFFFRSLAADQRQRAIGVILSGTGTDGTLGVKAIKAAGGFVIAQAPDTAEHCGMPASAIDAGVVDQVLTPEDIPQVLEKYARHPYVRDVSADPQPSEEPPPEAAGEEGFEAIIALMQAHAKHDFRKYKPNTLMRRTRRRMCLHHIDDFPAYLSYLRAHPHEIDALAQDLLIAVTDFFREPQAWEALRELAVRPLVQRTRPDETIRVWTPGCTTGEEPYSIAMLILEELKAAGKNSPLNVFASDVDKRALDLARAGRYPKSITADVSRERLNHFFTAHDGNDFFHVNKVLRETVVFAYQNLIADPPFSKLDLLCCRNLLIYLKPEVQEQVIALFHFALREGGILFLGSAETIGSQSDLFEPLDRRWRIFRRKGPTRHDRVNIPISDLPHRREIATPSTPQRRDTHLAHLAQQRLIDVLAPSAVLIDSHWQILYVSGDVDPYLTHKSGMPTDDLLDKARRGLRSKLRVAVKRALSERRSVSVTARVQRDRTYHRVKIMVRLVHNREQDEDLALVLFDEADPVVRPSQEDSADSDRDSGGKGRSHSSIDDKSPAASAGFADEEVDDHAVIRQLEEELAATKDDLQASVEQLESSNEEFKASNEEVMSINEELQSTNEELETSKEELQSLNEELATVNSQLSIKVGELETQHADLENLLAVTDVATLCLDTNLAIRWFTPQVRQVIRLREADKGRPLADFTDDFSDGDLVEMAERVLKTLIPLEDEAVCTDDRVLVRRATPFRTDDHRIDGVVITFFDITKRKKHEREFAEDRDLANNIIDTIREPLLVLDNDLRVKRASESFYRSFEVVPHETIGRPVYELGNGQWDIPALRKSLEEVLSENNGFSHFEIEHEFESIGHRTMLLNGQGINGLPLVLLAIEDITDRRRAEKALQSLTERLEEQVAQRTEMLRILQDVTRSANEARTVEEAMRYALGRIAQYDGWKFGHVWQIDEQDSGEMVSSGIWFVVEGAEKVVTDIEEFRRECATMRFSPGQGLVGAVVDSGEPKWVDDIDQYPDWQRRDATKLGFHAAITVPVTLNGEVVAVLEFFSDRAMTREQRFVEILPNIGIQLGHVIERKRFEKRAADAAEQERRRIGRDIHDGIGQELTGLRHLAHTHAEALAQQSLPEADVATRIAEGLKSAQRQLRTIIRELVPVELDKQGLVAALGELARRTTELRDLVCTLDYSEPIAIENNLVATHIYRIAQEAVANAVNHAQAEKIIIRLESDNTNLDLQVIDDGVGIGPRSIAREGFGLQSITSRAELLGGRARIEAGEAGGTIVRCIVPFKGFAE